MSLVFDDMCGINDKDVLFMRILKKGNNFSLHMTLTDMSVRGDKSPIRQSFDLGRSNSPIFKSLIAATEARATIQELEKW